MNERKEGRKGGKETEEKGDKSVDREQERKGRVDGGFREKKLDESLIEKVCRA